MSNWLTKSPSIWNHRRWYSFFFYFTVPSCAADCKCHWGDEGSPVERMIPLRGTSCYETLINVINPHLLLFCFFWYRCLETNVTVFFFVGVISRISKDADEQYERELQSGIRHQLLSPAESAVALFKFDDKMRLQRWIRPKHIPLRESKG